MKIIGTRLYTLFLTLIATCLIPFSTAQESRLDADGNIREDAYIRIPLNEENQRYADIDGSRMKQLVQEEHI